MYLFRILIGSPETLSTNHVGGYLWEQYMPRPLTLLRAQYPCLISARWPQAIMQSRRHTNRCHTGLLDTDTTTVIREIGAAEQHGLDFFDIL